MSTPSLSVVIPALDDAPALRTCLSLLEQQSLRPLEVVVVDNASTDDTAAVALAAGARVVTEPVRGVSPAACTGYDQARGAVIVRCDADTRPPADWLARVAQAFAQDPRLDGLTGPGRFYDLPPVLGHLAGIWYLLGMFGGVGAAAATVPLWGSNMAVRASSWRDARDRVHRVDPLVHDDLDLSFALGPRAKVRLDLRLAVGVQGRMFHSRAATRQRLSRAMYTIRLHWRQQPPGHRWAERLDPGRRLPALHG